MGEFDFFGPLTAGGTVTTVATPSERDQAIKNYNQNSANCGAQCLTGVTSLSDLNPLYFGHDESWPHYLLGKFKDGTSGTYQAYDNAQAQGDQEYRTAGWNVVQRADGAFKYFAAGGEKYVVAPVGGALNVLSATTEPNPATFEYAPVPRGVVFSLKSAAADSKAADTAGQEAAAANATGGATPVAAGEPVSVANGEYLETWRDFLIPGSLGLDGARYMGLKMPLPTRWKNPLGACQISAFDEIISNPKPRNLQFHQADGKAISFDRPFNFLPSINGAFPHLEMRAPSLGKLQLKDRKRIKHFIQYDDRFYRLEKIEDLNGNTLQFHRSEAGILEKIVNSDGIALLFANDADGRRTSITLIGTDGSRIELARYAYDIRGRMASAGCAFSMSVRYYWDATKPLLLRWHNKTQRSQTVFTYDEQGRVIHTATNGIWNGDRFRYDSGRRETTYLPGGEEERAQRFGYDENENVTIEADALGNTTYHEFDEFGFCTSTTDANGNANRVTYDIRGNVRSVVDAEGRETFYGWGPHGDLDISIDGAGNVRKFENDNKGNIVVARDAEGNETRFERDMRGRVTKTVFADGTEERRAYDQYGRLAGIRNPNGGITLFTYDPFGRLISTRDPAEKITTLAYAAGAGGFATPTSLTRPDGVSVSRTFDAEGSLTRVVDGEGRIWTYEFGGFEVPKAVIDSQGGRLAFSHDNEGRLTAVGNAKGQIWQFVRDVAGRVIREEDFDGRRIFYNYDPAGRVIETRQEDGARSTFQYDKTGLLLREDSFDPDTNAGNGKPEDVTRYWYDARGLLAKAENNSALVEFQRDKNGRIISETVNGRRVESRLDVKGNRVERRIGQDLVRTSHDPLGLVAEIVIGDHAPLAFTRDKLGRETRRESDAGFYLAQGYDVAGQLTSQSVGFSIASLGKGVEGMMRAQQLGISPRPVLERAFSWDRALSPLAIKDNSWGETQYQYDGNGRVVQAAHGDGSGERFRYDAAHNIAGFAQGVRAAAKPQTRGYNDGAGYVPPDSSGVGFTSWQSTPGGKVKQAVGPFGERVFITHDERGRVTERRVERDGFRSRRWLYIWDVKDRLIACKTPDHETWRYGYDPFGRRVWKVKQFSEAEARNYTHSDPHLIDPKRIPDRGAHYVPAQRSKLDIDRSGTSGKSPIVGVHYSWDGDVLAEEAPLRLDGSVDWDQATTWHYEPGTFRPLAKQTSDGTLLYIVTDHLGTPREMFDEQGKKQWAAEYRLWGDMRRLWKAEPANDNAADNEIWNSRPSSPSADGGGRGRVFGALAPKDEEEFASFKAECPIRFQGQWEDQESGLFYNRHRYYDPLAGQYMCPDPIGLKGGPRPQGYVINPNLRSDPFGLRGIVSPSADSQAGGASPYAKYTTNNGMDWDWAREAPNNGAVPGTEKTMTLEPGTIIDRYGKDRGKFVSPINVPFEHRSLPPGTKADPYRVFIVQKSITVDSAIAAPAFDQPGGGMQYYLPDSVTNLLGNQSLGEYKP